VILARQIREIPEGRGLEDTAVSSRTTGSGARP
jgi:hypothetical protein